MIWKRREPRDKDEDYGSESPQARRQHDRDVRKSKVREGRPQTPEPTESDIENEKMKEGKTRMQRADIDITRATIKSCREARIFIPEPSTPYSYYIDPGRPFSQDFSVMVLDRSNASPEHPQQQQHNAKAKNDRMLSFFSKSLHVYNMSSLEHYAVRMRVSPTTGLATKMGREASALRRRSAHGACMRNRGFSAGTGGRRMATVARVVV